MKLPNILKEPVVQFTLLGALLFALDHFLILNRDDPRNVLVDDAQMQALIAMFEEGQGRAPSGSEINNMVIAWAQNEILYREARRMGLDRGDEMIQNRLVLKIHNIFFNNVVVDYPDDEQLAQFFALNRDAYRIPERYDLEMLAFPGHLDRDTVQRIKQGKSDDHGVEGIRYHYENRTRDNIISLFGNQNATEVLRSIPHNDGWKLISNAQGHHLVRVTAVHAAIEPSLDSVRSRVIRDWERYTADTQIADQTHDIARQYRVQLDLSNTYLDLMDAGLPRNPFPDVKIDEH